LERKNKKEWNINVEGKYEKLKKDLMYKIEILEKRNESTGISNSEIGKT
jgi:hypothetical protein